jgi:hypothetical protein
MKAGELDVAQRNRWRKIPISLIARETANKRRKLAQWPVGVEKVSSAGMILTWLISSCARYFVFLAD